MSGLSDIAELVMQQVRAEDSTPAFRIDYYILTEIGTPDSGTVKAIIHNGSWVWEMSFNTNFGNASSVRFDEPDDVAKMLIATAKAHNQDSVELHFVPFDAPRSSLVASVKTMAPSFLMVREPGGHVTQVSAATCADVIVSAMQLCTKMKPAPPQENGA